MRYEPGDEVFMSLEDLRTMGRLLCHCGPGPVTPDPEFPAQCARCLRRIHRRYDPPNQEKT